MSKPTPIDLAREALSRARSDLVLNHPFFGTIALRLSFESDGKCRDLWSNGRKLGFNAGWVNLQSRAALEAALAHEVLHLACKHHLRRQNRDFKQWNQACDLAVNLLLQEAGFKLPKDFPLDPKYAGMSADEIFEVLTKLLEQDPHGGAAKEQQKGETRQNYAGGQSLGGPKEGNERENQARARKSDQRDLSKGEKGSHGQDGSKGGDGGDTSFQGEIRDHPSLAPKLDERQGIDDATLEADIALTMALRRALGAGDLPANFQRLFSGRIRAQLDWRGLLQRFIEIRIDNDSTWCHPNRRYIHQGLYLPSRSEPNLPNLALAIDTSGSVDNDKLGQFCAELSAILEAYDTEITVIFHDCQVQDVLTFGRMDLPLNLTPRGGGGTDYRPVTAWLDQSGLDPVCLLWLTDLECAHFPEEPSYPVLWISLGRQTTHPPFGEWIQMS